MDTLYTCPWCHKTLPRKDHIIEKFLETWFIGCPYYSHLEPTFLNKELYRIQSPSRLVKI